MYRLPANGMAAAPLAGQRRYSAAVLLPTLLLPRTVERWCLTISGFVVLQLPVLLSSGYAEGETLERFPGLTAGSFLPKPYGPRDLLSKVQALLAEG